jgi:hypothetical protein
MRFLNSRFTALQTALDSSSQIKLLEYAGRNVNAISNRRFSRNERLTLDRRNRSAAIAVLQSECLTGLQIAWHN